MRKVFVILLICCLFLNMGGYIFIIRQRQLALKNEMMLRIHSGCDLENVQEFEFMLVNGKPADPAFHWIEDEEFTYKGKMYDVVGTISKDGILKIKCIDDSKEEALLSYLLMLHEKQDGKPAKSRTAIQLLISMLYIPVETTLQTSPQFFFISHHEHYLSYFKPVPREVIVPPPRA